MEWTIKAFAKKMNVSANKLRYYEEQGLLVPKRDTNNYRIYTKTEKRQMEYILVMRYAHFSIKEIKTFMDLLNQPLSSDCNKQGTFLFNEKIASLEKTIQTYQEILLLMQSVPMLADYQKLEKNYEKIKKETDTVIQDIFQKIRSEVIE